MKYYSTDINDFLFHDAHFNLISWEDGRLVISAKNLNVRKSAAPNNDDTDMEISEAIITIDGMNVKELEPHRAWMQDDKGEPYTNDPFIVYTSNTARELFEKELKNNVWIYAFGAYDEIYYIDAGGIIPFFAVRFDFSSIRIEWDSYCNKAWYET